MDLKSRSIKKYDNLGKEMSASNYSTVLSLQQMLESSDSWKNLDRSHEPILSLRQLMEAPASDSTFESYLENLMSNPSIPDERARQIREMEADM